MSDILIIGSIDHQAHYSPAQIDEILQQEGKTLEQGADFTGKPKTGIHTNGQHVVKLHGETCLEPIIAKAWVQKAVLKERAYRVYHPHKTWFIQIKQGEKCALIGNISPALTPLHILFDNNDKPPIKQYLYYLQQLFDMYFNIAKQLNFRLDEGLSNFAFDDNKVLYYLDDDIYPWDKTITLGQMLGVYFRSLEWINQTVARQIGQLCQTAILKAFNSFEYTVVLAEQAKHVFIPNDKVNQCINGFVQGLTQKPQKTSIKPENQPIDTKKDPVKITEPKVIVSPEKSTPVITNNKFAVLADIHSNQAALEVVLAYLKEHNIQQGWVLGDVVGYGAHPKECIELLQQSNLTVIKGNHDNAIALDEYPLFSKNAAWVIDWTQQQLNSAEKEWLEELPSVLETPEYLLIHGAPIDPTFFNGYIYTMTYETNLDVLEKRNIPLCFHGHTHMPTVFARRKNNNDQQYDVDFFDFNRCDYALVCAGSVGQPRNQAIKAQFAIYDADNNTLQRHYLDYDVDRSIADMEQHKFPVTLIHTLQGIA